MKNNKTLLCTYIAFWNYLHFFYRYYCLEGAFTSAPTDGVTGGPCPEGYYCPEGSIQPVLCDPGTYVSVTHATHCEPCLPGWYCVSGSFHLCPAGVLLGLCINIFKHMHLSNYQIRIFREYIKFCSFPCRFFLPWRNRIWLERLSWGNIRSWPWLLVRLTVQAVWRRLLLLLQKWHYCHRTMSGRILLFTRKHFSTTPLR